MQTAQKKENQHPTSPISGAAHTTTKEREREREKERESARPPPKKPPKTRTSILTKPPILINPSPPLTVREKKRELRPKLSKKLQKVQRLHKKLQKVRAFYKFLQKNHKKLQKIHLFLALFAI
jgi:hypothetical protein